MYKKILVPIDLDDQANAVNALENATSLPLAEGGEIHVLTVVPTFGMSIVGSFFDDEFEKRAMGEMQSALTAFLETGDYAAKVAHGHVAHGTIYEEIIRVSQELGCDLIVMSAHRPELKDYLLGPNAARVVRHAKQSVFVTRSR